MGNNALGGRREEAIRREQANKLFGVLLFAEKFEYICKNRFRIRCLEQCYSLCSQESACALWALLEWKKNAQKGNLSVPEGFRKLLTSIFSSTFSNLPSVVDQIRWVARTYMHAAQKVYSEFPKQIMPGRLAWERMESAAVACTLTNWLRYQPNMRQGVYDFAVRPFGVERSGYTDDIYDFFKGVQGDITMLLKMGQVQAKLEGAHVASLGTDYAYTELCGMELAGNTGKDNRLRLLRRITRRKEFLKVWKDETKLFELAIEFENYYEILDEITKYAASAEYGDILSCKRFVASTMLINLIEESNRLYLAAAITNYSAKRRWKRGYTIREQEKDAINFLWARRAELLGQRWMIGAADPNKIVPPEMGMAHNLLNYKADVEAIFKHPGDPHYLYELKQMILKREQNDMLTVLKILFPLRQLPAWTDYDFQQAFYFFKNKYNVAEELKEYPFPKLEEHLEQSESSGRRRNKGIFDRYRDVYLFLLSLGDSPTKPIHEIYQEAKKIK